MTSPKDDWDKPRSRAQHLSAEEIASIRAAYKAGRSSREVARELKCSSRIASKYYGLFRAEGVPIGAKAISLRLPRQVEGSEIAPATRSKLMAGR